MFKLNIVFQLYINVYIEVFKPVDFFNQIWTNKQLRRGGGD